MATLPAARLLPGSFFGRCRRVAHVSDLILSETHYPSALTVPPHVHERAYFGLLLRGGYCEDLGTRVVDFEPSSVVFHPAREVRYGDVGARGATLLHAEIPEGWTLRLREHGGLPRDAVVDRGGPLVRLGMALYRELRADDAASALIAEGLVLEMLGLLVRLPRRGAGRPPRWLDEAVELVHEEFKGPLTIRGIADRIGVGAVHLARTFRRHRGESIGDCVRRLRVELARRLLDEGHEDLPGLALEAGFADQSHFTRTFRRMTGTTPAEYRRAHNKAR
jgi:AraC family transcriptional regulator